MKQDATRRLYDYWNGLRGDRAAPDRADIDPAAIRAILSETFMLESDPARKFPIRLSGSRFSALWCSEIKGASFLDLWGGDRHHVAAILLTVMDGATPAVVGARAAPKGYPKSELEMLFLPLRHYGKTHARILGCASLTVAPSWLGLLSVDNLYLTSLRFLEERFMNDCAPLLHRIEDEQIYMRRAMEETPAFRRATDRMSHLRVYEGGKTEA